MGSGKYARAVAEREAEKRRKHGRAQSRAVAPDRRRYGKQHDDQRGDKGADVGADPARCPEQAIGQDDKRQSTAAFEKERAMKACAHGEAPACRNSPMATRRAARTRPTSGIRAVSVQSRCSYWHHRDMVERDLPIRVLNERPPSSPELGGLSSSSFSLAAQEQLRNQSSAARQHRGDPRRHGIRLGNRSIPKPSCPLRRQDRHRRRLPIARYQPP